MISIYYLMFNKIKFVDDAEFMRKVNGENYEESMNY